MNRHALDVLELAEALDRVARFASSELGAAGVRALEPRTDDRWIRAELDAVGQMTRLIDRESGWHMPAFPDAREPLRRVRVEGSTLLGPQLRALGDLLEASRRVRREVEPLAETLPTLAARAALLVELPKLGEEIERAIDEDGEVRDNASPQLARLRREISGARQRIVGRLSSYAQSLPDNYRVADASVSVREGRYVIPVRREGRGEVGGIVHGESGTGATLFIEPPLAIELMNRLRELEGEEAREVQRILRELTARLRPHRDEMEASLAALVQLDSWYARGRYARHVHGTPPEVHADAAREYEVVEGRHPLLIDQADTVVPFDLRMAEDERTLLISGPNTGGKTVLLKSIGLISLLAQSGVVPPVGPGTRLPVFDAVFADIGDEQSIEASLSTFSAHLKNLRETLDAAGGQSLVLIDEIGSGTDPVEGAALAQSILLELTRRAAFTVATTHLGQLKLLPAEDARIVNASLQFDAERLEPTYRLLKGLPGRSYGLAIARRLGLPEPVLEQAEQAMPEGERDVARLLLELEAKEQRLADGLADLELREGRVGEREERVEDREQRQKQREQDAERRARQQARELLLQSRREVETAIAEVQGAAGAAVDEAARAARRRVEEAAERQRKRTPEQPEPEPTPRRREQPLEPGLRVRIESLGKTGTVLELRDSRALVEVGGLKMQLARNDLAVLPPGDQDKPRQASRGSFGGGGSIDISADARPEVDLRGMRVEEMDLELQRALDAAMMAGLPSFRIIHGKGTGVLRARVQELLDADRRITRFRPGERFEGGTGVTVVEF